MTPLESNARTRFAVLVDGSKGFGSVNSVSGGTIRGQLATGALGSGMPQRKRISAIAYDDFVVEVGLDGAKGLLDWISTSFAGGGMSRTGEMHTTDVDYQSTSVREFFSAVITEVTVPTCDAASNEVNYLTVKIKPAGLRYRLGEGGQINVPTPNPKKKWVSSNFRVELGGLSTDHIHKIDSFTWKQNVIKTDKEPLQIPSVGDTSPVEVPNVRLTISMADIDPWMAWFQSFVIEGNSAESNEMNGSIGFLSPDLQHTLGSVGLSHVGPVSLGMPGAEANADQVALFTVELYCQDMQFHYAGGA